MRDSVSSKIALTKHNLINGCPHYMYLKNENKN